MKNFVSVHDVKNIDALVQKALAYKAKPFMDKMLGTNKRIGCLFLNPSMRTRLSTQIAAQNLGMEVITFNVGSEGWALEFEEEAIMSGTTVEHVKDAAPIFGKYFDILAIRTFPSLKNREDYELNKEFTKGATITHNQEEALKGADFVYVKNWSTYQDYGKIYTNNPKWMLKEKRWALTNHAKVMHCLPVRRNVELSDEILDGPMSIVTQQAANRVWAAQSVLSEILKNNG